MLRKRETQSLHKRRQEPDPAPRLRLILRCYFQRVAAFAVCFKRLQRDHDALQKSQFSGELSALKAVFAQCHVAVQHGIAMAVRLRQAMR